MRNRLIVAFVLGTGLFALLPILFPPVVLQSDEIPRYLLGFVGAAIVGASLVPLSGHRWAGVWLCLVCPLIGALIYETTYVVAQYGFGGPWAVLRTFFHFGVPAVLAALVVGAVLGNRYEQRGRAGG